MVLLTVSSLDQFSWRDGRHVLYTPCFWIICYRSFWRKCLWQGHGCTSSITKRQHISDDTRNSPEWSWTSSELATTITGFQPPLLRCVGIHKVPCSWMRICHTWALKSSIIDADTRINDWYTLRHVAHFVMERAGKGSYKKFFDRVFWVGWIRKWPNDGIL